MNFRRSLAWVWITLWVPLFASAHPFLQNSWWVVVETNRVVCRVSATLREIAVVQGLGGSTNSVDLQPVLAALHHHGDYILKTLELSADGKRLSGEVLDFQLSSEAATDAPPGSPFFLEQSHATFDLEFPKPPQTRELSFGQKTLKEYRYAPGIPWDVTYALMIRDGHQKELGAGLVRAELPFQLLLTATSSGSSSTSQPPAPEESKISPVRWGDYVRLGIHHILGGYDHLLFLAALALAVVSLGDFLKLILTFTLAHSVTVTLSALNWVRLPSWFVEPFIAASIVYVAAENLIASRGVPTPRRWAIAFGFGLIHGLGFAGGLTEALGSTKGSALVLGIVGFCLGVELGHLAVGLPFWSLIRGGALRWGAAFRIHLIRCGSILVAAGGSYFLWAALRQYL